MRPSPSADNNLPLEITSELRLRMARAADYEAETRALVRFAQDIERSPRNVLQTLVESALTLCEAHSAGLSILEEKGRVFRWSAVVGRWSKFIGSTVPRGSSPCGLVLERNAVLLLSHPERRYSFGPGTPPINEALLVPFYAAGEAVGTLWVLTHDDSKKFDAEDERLVTDLARCASFAYQVLTSLDSIETQMVIATAAEAELRASKNELAAELAGAQQLQKISTQLVGEQDFEALHEKLVEAAAAIMGSECASMQLFYPERGAEGELRLLAFRGFTPEAAKTWEWVSSESGTCCGEALRAHARIIIPDLENSDRFPGIDRASYLQTGIRAVQTTPLISRRGELLGALSTHWRAPHEPGERELRLFDVLARQAADLIERKRAEDALRDSKQFVEAQVRARTLELERRNADVVRHAERLREVSARLVRVQDDERRHMARELHDSAGQTLAALDLNLASIAAQTAQGPSQLAREAQEGQELVQQLSQEIRTLSYLLHPPLLEENGLGQSLRWYVDGVAERSGLDITLDVSDDFARLPGDMELALFRVVQECLTNIHRHSGSKTAKIQLARDTRNVMLKVQDEGAGISPEKLAQIQSNGSGVGVRGMRERIQQLQGEMSIESNGRGTRVLVSLPAPAKNSEPAPAGER